MKSIMTFKAALLALAATLILILSGCATVADTDSVSNETPAPAPEPIEPWDGDGMDIPLDGSSLEAFNTSLARVKAHTNPSSYRTLVNAIEYLLFYDLGAKHDRTMLAARLDGLTGREVIDKVSWQRKR